MADSDDNKKNLNIEQNTGELASSPVLPSEQKSQKTIQETIAEKLESVNDGLLVVATYKDKLEEVQKDVSDVKQEVQQKFKNIDERYLHFRAELDSLNEQIKLSKITAETSKPEEKTNQQKVDEDKKNAKTIKSQEKETQEKDSNEDAGISPSLKNKLKKIITSLFPGINFTTSKFKTTSTIDSDKPKPVVIKAFSQQANKQFLENLKQVIVIKKKQEEHTSRLNIMQLSILLITSLIVYLVAKLSGAFNVFSGWIADISAAASDIGKSVAGIGTDIWNVFKNYIYNPVATAITALNNVWNDITTGVSPTLKNMSEACSEALNTLVSCSSSFITGIADVATHVITYCNNEFAKWANNLLGKQYFKVTDTPLTSDGALHVSDLNPDQPSGMTELHTPSTYSDGDKTSNPPSNNNITQFQETVNTLQDKSKVNLIANIKSATPVSPGTSNEEISLLQSNAVIVNDKAFMLHKNDDIYIANKPDGIIDKTFKQIHATLLTIVGAYTQYNNNTLPLLYKILINISNTNNISKQLQFHNNIMMYASDTSSIFRQVPNVLSSTKEQTRKNGI